MGDEAEDLMDRVMALREEDRQEFARRLIGKLSTDPDVLEAWHDEAERRWVELERGDVVAAPWDEVRQRIFGTR